MEMRALLVTKVWAIKLYSRTAVSQHAKTLPKILKVVLCNIWTVPICNNHNQPKLPCFLCLTTTMIFNKLPNNNLWLKGRWIKLWIFWRGDIYKTLWWNNLKNCSIYNIFPPPPVIMIRSHDHLAYSPLPPWAPKWSFGLPSPPPRVIARYLNSP